LHAGLAFEADMWLDEELDLGGAQELGEHAPVRHRQDHAEMRHRHRVAIDRIAAGDRSAALDAVGDDLVAIQVEIDPVGVAATLGATEDAAIEGAGFGDVPYGERDMEGPQAHAGTSVTICATASVSRVA